jgi:hypothetical protein
MRHFRFGLKLGLSVLLLCACVQLYPQDASSSSSSNDNSQKFKLSGYGSFDFANPSDGNGSFVQAIFAPVFTWRATDRLFFQAEVEFASEGDNYDGAFELEFANINYMLGKHITVYAGKFLGPLGNFQPRLHPAWINKSVNKPVGNGNKINGLKRLQAGSEAGFGFKGGFNVGSSKFNYDVYVSNGAILDTTSGELEAESLADNNKNKAIGGRLGFLPFSNSSFEIGVFGYTAKVGEIGSAYENLKTNLYGFDINFVKPTSFGTFDIKGEYQKRKVDDAIYYDDASGSTGFTYDNSPSVFYGQFAYRLPAASNATWVGNFEIVARYANMSVDKNSPFGSNVNQMTFGLNYWLNFSTVFKIGYDTQNFDGVADNQNMLIIQAAIGF